MSVIQKIRSRLVHRLVVYLVAFSVLMTLLISGILLYVEYKRDLRQIEAQFQQIETSFLPSLTTAVWFYNPELMRSHLEGMRRLRDIVYLEILDQEKQVLASGAPDVEDGVARTFPLRYTYNDRERIIGTLKATASMKGVYQRLHDRVVAIIVSSAAQMVLMSMFVLALVRFMLTDHLEKIADFLKHVDVTRESPAVQLIRRPRPPEARDELDHVVDAVNRLMAASRNAYRDVAARVAEQTAQLEVINHNLKQEIVERNRIEEHLREREARYRRLVDATPDVLYAYSTVRGGIFYSPSVETVLGYSRETLLASPNFWRNSIHPADIPAVSAVVSNLKPDVRFEVEYRIRAADGEWRWFIDRSIAVEAGDGEMIVEGLAIDITRRKQVELALQTREAILDSFFNSPGVMRGVVELAADDIRHVSDNAESAAFFGTTREAMRGRSAGEMGVPRHVLDFWIRHYRESANTRRPVVFEYRHETETGVRWLSATVSPIGASPEGEPRFSYEAVDITDQKRTAEKLLESEARFRALIAQAADAIFLFDETGRFMMVNQAACRSLGYSETELRGMAIPEIDIDFDEKRVEEVNMGIRPGERRLIKTRHRRRDGTVFPVEVSLGCFDLNDRRNFLALVRDISDRVAAETTLEKAMTELARSNKELEQFAYIASHDLQEPLRKISVFVDRVLAKDYDRLDERSQDYMNRVKAATLRMKALINDLLAYSRLTTRAAKPKPGDLTQVVQGVLQDLEMEMETSGAIVHMDPLPEIRMDPMQMKQLFQNLLSNAIKFRAPGRPPVIRVEYAPENGWHVIRVRDDGIGFDEKYLDKIFNPFQRLHGRTQYEGSGMGLAICEKVMHRHGGEITAESWPGAGAVFVLKFPREAETKEEFA